MSNAQKFDTFKRQVNDKYKEVRQKYDNARHNGDDYQQTVYNSQLNVLTYIMEVMPVLEF